MAKNVSIVDARGGVLPVTQAGDGVFTFEARADARYAAGVTN